MVSFKDLDLKSLEGKTIVITKVERDNLEIDLDGKKCCIYPFCRSCEYNDEVLIGSEIIDD